MPRLSVVGSERKSANERVDARLAAEENRGLLRFLTCGSVDDGKSTLIGRLLYDSALVYEDQVRQPMEALLFEIERDLGPDMEVKIFRLNRDLRFSPDKRPYKEHLGAYLSSRRAGG